MNIHFVYNFIKILPILINFYIFILIGSFFLFGYYTEYSFIFLGHSLVVDIPLFLCSWNPKGKLTNKVFKYVLPRLPLCKWHRVLSLNLTLISIIEYINCKFMFSILECYIVDIIFLFTSASLFYTIIYNLRHGYKKSSIKDVKAGIEPLHNAYDAGMR